MENDYNLIYFDAITYETVCITKDNKSVRFKGKPPKLINMWCLKCGSSMTGRMTSFKYVLDVKQKPCILISERKKLMYLPTMSIDSDQCYYVQFGCIKKIIKVENRRTKIVTKKGDELLIPCDHRVIQKQYQRAVIYLFKLNLNETNSLSL